MIRRLSESHRWLVALLLVGSVAAAVDFYHIGEQSFWNDEFLALQYSIGRFVHEPIPTDVLIAQPPLITHPDRVTSWWAACESLRFDTHPPLYFMVLRVWRTLFGSSEAAVRSLSCMTMTAAVMLLAATVKLLDGKVAGFFGGLAMAVSTTQIQYAQEARNYGLLMMLAMTAAYLTARIFEVGCSRSRLIGLGFCMLLMQLSHNFAVAAIAALCVFAWQVMPRAAARKVCLAAGSAMLVYAVTWGPFLWSQARVNKRVSSYLYQDVADHGYQTIIRLLCDPARLLVGFGATMYRAEQVPLWSVAMTLAIIAWAVYHAKHRPSLMLWAIWFGCVVGLIAASDGVRSTHLLQYIRYMILALPALCGMIGTLSVGGWPKKLLAAGCVFAIATQLPNGYPKKPLWRQAAAAIASEGRADEPIVFATAHSGYPDPRDMYMALSTYLPDENKHPAAVLSHAPDPDLVRAVAAGGSAWVVTDRHTPLPSTWLAGSKEQQQVDISGTEVMFHVSF